MSRERRRLLNQTELLGQVLSLLTLIVDPQVLTDLKEDA